MNSVNPYNTPESRFIKKLKDSCEKYNLVTNEDKINAFLNCRVKYQFKSEEINITELKGDLWTNSNNIDNLQSFNSKINFTKI